MENIYHIPFDAKLSAISCDVHQDIFTLLKQRNPKASLFCEDPELEQLYFALILIRAGYLRFSENDEVDPNYILLEVLT